MGAHDQYHSCHKAEVLQGTQDIFMGVHKVHFPHTPLRIKLHFKKPLNPSSIMVFGVFIKESTSNAAVQASNSNIFTSNGTLNSVLLQNNITLSEKANTFKQCLESAEPSRKQPDLSQLLAMLGPLTGSPSNFQTTPPALPT